MTTTKTKTKTEDLKPAPEARGNTAIVKAQASALVEHAGNPWIEVATELDKFLGAALLKFSKQGEFTLADEDIIEDGTQAIARIDLAELGWMRWWDNKRTEMKMDLVANGVRATPRSELGDNDPEQWEQNDDGTSRDPWAFTANLPVTLLDSGETFLFTSSSKGGLSAVHKLIRAYGTRVKNEKMPGLPVIALKADSYKHPRYGKIFKPQFSIVNWTDAAGKPLSLADDMNDEIGI